MKLAIGVVLALIFAGIGVYYLIPGIPHILVSNAATSTQMQLKHVLAAFVVAAVCLVGGIFAHNGDKAQAGSR